MAQVNFPNSPVQNQTYTQNGITWIFNLGGWELDCPPAALQSWASTLVVGNTSGARNPIIDDNQFIDFLESAKTIMEFVGSVGDERLINLLGNLLFKVSSLGITVNGTTTVAQMNASGLVQGLLMRANSFYQDELLVLTDAATTNFPVDSGDIAEWTITANRTFAFTGTNRVRTKNLFIIQGGAGSFTVTWPANIKWGSGTAPVLSTAPGAVDVISFVSNGTNYHGTEILNFS